MAKTAKNTKPVEGNQPPAEVVKIGQKDTEQVDIAQNDVSQSDASQADDSNADDALTDDVVAEGAQGDVSQTDASQVNDSNTDESLTDDVVAEDVLFKILSPVKINGERLKVGTVCALDLDEAHIADLILNDVIEEND